MILAVTGHRPDKLGGYWSHVMERLTEFAETQLRKLKPDVVISGMALGWDQAIAEAAIDLNIDLHAYIPFEGQELKWPAYSQKRYKELMSCAQKIVICSPGGYEPWKMQERNKQMVDAADMLLALYNGSVGGTQNCMVYADRYRFNIRHKKKFEIVNVWDEWNTGE